MGGQADASFGHGFDFHGQCLAVPNPSFNPGWRDKAPALNPNSQPSSFNNHRISLSLALSICPR
jgi:hypothetical protein